MNQYTVIASFKGYLNLEDIERLFIPNGTLKRCSVVGNSDDLYLPSGCRVERGNNEEYQLKIDYETTSLNHEAYANFIIDRYLTHISLFLGTPVMDARVIKITCHGADSDSHDVHYANISGSVFIVRPPVSSDFISKTNRMLNCLIDNDEDEKARLAEAFSKAISNSDRYKKYWELYSLLDRLSSAYSGSERTRINSCLLQEYPEDELHHNDNMNQDNHLVIAIRDTLSHIDSRHNGEYLDVASNITIVNDRMKCLVRKILLARFEL